MKCLYTDHQESEFLIIDSVAYNDDHAVLIGISKKELLPHTIMYVGKKYSIFHTVNLDHLLYSPDTFLKKNDFIHYSDKKLDFISPLTLNIGNKLSNLSASSFWTISDIFYPDNLYGDRSYISNLIFVFYRRLIKSIFPQTKDILISTDKDIKIYIRSSFYNAHIKEFADYSIYEYHSKQYGFFSSLGGEYSIKEFTFDFDIKPDSYKIICFRDYTDYVELLDDAEFEEKMKGNALIFQKHHFCELINKNKPSFYYDYDELIIRRNEINSSKADYVRKIYSTVDNTDIFGNTDIMDDIYITADLHFGKKCHDYEEICAEIDAFWDKNHLHKDYLLLLGDIIDADYLTDEQYICITKYFLSKAPEHTILIKGNNDRSCNGIIELCGYEAVYTELIIGKFVFTHMPVCTDGVIVNVHGHLHGRTNYINITPYHHIDAGYKANNFRILTLRDYIRSSLSDIDKRKRQDIDMQDLFDEDTLSLVNSYRTIYSLENLFSEYKEQPDLKAEDK